ncbi:major facilitator superfamily domain-containing protein [Apodospora peruviana]|uniref:Major facilitator superfamily domain-containing protein n=1 Tax=Apodospora peruviana TaxID=516989 RepID=A0AAE0ITD4_9PEZI|nr:major facilitator superfamily domain-containing protein [Apodospora peruviana]
MARHSSDDGDTDFDGARLEEAPLLPTTTTSVEDKELEAERRRLRLTVIVIAAVVLFLLELGIGVSTPAMNSIMEKIICRQVHPEIAVGVPHGSPVPDKCKDTAVQGYLVMLRGWTATFESIPGFLGSVAYGIVSDKWGRKPVLSLAIFGLNLNWIATYAIFIFSDIVPLWWIWFAQLLMLVGGGGMVATAMLYTILADVVPVEDRSTVFFQVSATFLASQTMSAPLSGYLMLYGDWLPLLVGLALLIIGNILIFLLPETVHLHRKQKQGRRGLARQEDDDSTESELAEVEDPKVSLFHEIREKARGGLAEVGQFILGNKNIVFLMLSMVFVVLGRLAQEFLLQYATKRYHWSWSEASFMMTITGVTSMVTLLGLLPAASWFCVSYLGLPGTVKDLWLARLSGIIMILGCLIIASARDGRVLSLGLVFWAMGSGLAALIRAILNALVEEHHTGILNSLIGFTETVGVMVAAPVLASSLRKGIQLGGGWIGLPFFIAALFATVVTAVAWTYRVPRRARQGSLEP